MTTTPYVVHASPGYDGTVLYYLQDDASVARYGVIERVNQFENIQPVANTRQELVAGSNALYDAAVEELRRRKSPVNRYKVNLAEHAEGLKIGDKIHIEFHDELTSGDVDVSNLSISGDFWVMGVDTDYTRGRIQTQLEISDVDIAKENATELIFSAIQTVKQKSFSPSASGSASGFVFTEDIDPESKMSIPLHFGSATKELQSVQVLLTTSEFRSNILSVSHEGTHKHQMFRAGNTSTTTLSGGDLTHREYFAKNVDGNERSVLTVATSEAADNLFTHDVIEGEGQTHAIEYGIHKDNQTPRNISLWLGTLTDASNVTLALTGMNHWRPRGGTGNIELDSSELTRLIKESGTHGTHYLHVQCEAGRGRVQAMVNIFQSVQAINVNEGG